MVATNGSGFATLLSTDSNMSLARGINGSGGKSYFQGEIYEVMVFAKSLMILRCGDWKDILLINGVLLLIFHQPTPLSQLDLGLEVRSRSIL